jgi:hypothetical protein
MIVSEGRILFFSINPVIAIWTLDVRAIATIAITSPFRLGKA